MPPRTRIALHVLLLSPLLAAGAEPAVTIVHPADNGAALRNPGMGWMLHYYDNVPRHYGSRLTPADTLPDWPGLTTVYLRIPWSFLEPEEGRFRWSVLDLRWTLHQPPGADTEPLLHVEQNGKLLHAGTGDLTEEDRNQLRQAGMHVTHCRIPLPPSPSENQPLAILCGLWNPSHMGRHSERKIPDHGNADRRVLLGSVHRVPGRQTRFVPEGEEESPTAD